MENNHKLHLFLI